MIVREIRVPWTDADDCVWVVRFYRAGSARYVSWRVWEAFDPDRDDPNTIADSDPYEFEGNTKWDGCSNWSTYPGVAAHSCDRHKLATVGVLLSRIYDEAADILCEPAMHDAHPVRA